MGTRIEAAATTQRRGHLIGRGSLHLADEAARAALYRGHRGADELDLLINTGIYRDRNTAEPALASIIQEDIGANVGGPPIAGRHGTFAFDVLNGGCGVVNAAQLIDGFVGNGHARCAMIVAADADPSPRTSEGFPFPAAGGAMLLGYADGDVGFERFLQRTFPEDGALFQAHLRWEPRAGFAHRTGRNIVEVFQSPEFAARCVAHATDVVRELLAASSLPIADVDLLIASQFPRGFARNVAYAVGIPAERVPDVSANLEGTHTAGPIAALEAAILSGAFARARHIVFVTAGAGLTIGTALYRGAGLGRVNASQV